MTDQQDKIQELLNNIMFKGSRVSEEIAEWEGKEQIQPPPRAKHLARIAQLETEVSKWKNAHKTINDLLNERVIECERLRVRLEVTNKAIGAALAKVVEKEGHRRGY